MCIAYRLKKYYFVLKFFERTCTTVITAPMGRIL